MARKLTEELFPDVTAKQDNTKQKDIAPKQSPEMDEREMSMAKEMANGERVPTDNTRVYPGGTVYKGYESTDKSRFGAHWLNYVKDGEKQKDGSVKHTGKWKSLID